MDACTRNKTNPPVDEGGKRTYRKAHHARGQPTARRHADDGENSSRQDDDTPEELEPYRQPAIRAHRGEIRPQVRIHAPLVLEREPRLLAVRADGGDAA